MKNWGINDEGRNLFLENVLDYLITNESDWYTSYALPWVKTDQLSVQWEVFRFNKTLMDLEPEQAPMRYVSAEREARTDRLVRRGLGFIIEHGFMTTEEGRKHYLMNLKQISDSVHETAYFGVMSALLNAHSYYKAHRAEHGPIRTNFGALTRRERNRWAVIQKDEHGLHMLDAEVRHEMRRHGRDRNMIVLPDSTSMYVTMVPEYNKEYSRHGPGNKANLELGEDNMLTFRGARVQESKCFDVDFVGESIDLTLRERQIGSYYVIPSGKDGIKIYSADSDRFETVLKGNILPAVHLVYRYDDVNNRLIRSNDPIGDETIIVVRPFQRYLMGSALFLNGGTQLGATYHGHHNFQLSDNIVAKTHVGHYTFYHKSIVKDDKNISIAEDVICRDYLGGEGHTNMTDEDLENAKMGNWDLVRGSLIHIVADQQITDLDLLLANLPNPLSLTGSFDGEPFAARYERDPASIDGYAIPDLASLYPRTSQNDQTRFLTDVRSNNSIVYQGMQLNLNNEITNLESGHWGINGVGPGSKAVRNGEMAFLKEKGYASKLVSAQPVQGPAGGGPLGGGGGGGFVGGGGFTAADLFKKPSISAAAAAKAPPSSASAAARAAPAASASAIPKSTAARRRAKPSKDSGLGGPSV